MTLGISDDLRTAAANGTPLSDPSVLAGAASLFGNLTGTARARAVAAYIIQSHLTSAAGASKEGWATPGDMRAIAERMVALLPDEVLTVTGIDSLDLLALLKQVTAAKEGDTVTNWDGTARTVTADEAKSSSEALARATASATADREGELRAAGAGLGKQGAALDQYVSDGMAALSAPATTVGVRPTAGQALATAAATPQVAGAPSSDQVVSDVFGPAQDGGANQVSDWTDLGFQNPPLTVEDLQNLYGFGGGPSNEWWSSVLATEAQRQAGANAGLTVPAGAGVDVGFGDPRMGGTRIGLKDTIDFIQHQTPSNLRAIQEKLIAAGMLDPTSDAYRPGLLDTATIDAWKKAVGAAFFQGQPVSQVLASQTVANDQLRQQALANRSYQITDPRKVRALADSVAAELIGRKVTDAEAKLIADRVQSEEIAAQQQSDQPGVTFYQPNIEASITDWLTTYRPQAVGLQDAFTQQQQIAKFRGQKPHFVDRQWNDMQWIDFANHMRVNNWSEAQVFAALTGTGFEDVNALGGGR